MRFLANDSEVSEQEKVLFQVGLIEIRPKRQEAPLNIPLRGDTSYGWFDPPRKGTRSTRSLRKRRASGERSPSLRAR
jgi:hypothetical protein